MASSSLFLFQFPIVFMHAVIHFNVLLTVLYEVLPLQYIRMNAFIDERQKIIIVIAVIAM